MLLKKFILYSFLFLFQIDYASGQAFHFQNTITTIIKNINQSPVHWYIQIYNDVNIDTTLHWRVDSIIAPAAWIFNFDDQNQFYSPVIAGDSADFVLYDSLQFPQKLIIGCSTNNTPGTGYAYITVYDPNDYLTATQIYYEFIITPLSGVNENKYLPFSLNIRDNMLSYLLPQKGTVKLFSSNGLLLSSESKKENTINLSSLSKGVYFYSASINGSNYVISFVR